MTLEYSAAINNDDFYLLRKMSQVGLEGYRVAYIVCKIEYVNVCVLSEEIDVLMFV